MYERDVKYINQRHDLTWDLNGFLLNPEIVNIGAGTPGNAFDVRNFRDALLTAVGSGTVLVYGSSQKDPPDFSKPSTILNSWVLIALVDYSLIGSTAFYAGATGAVVSNSTMLAELDTNLLTWIGLQQSGEMSNVDVMLTLASTQ